MKHGEFYRVSSGTATDVKNQRVYIVVSRQELIDSGYSTLICAPIYGVYEGLSTEVPVGMDEGLRQPGAIRCDELVSVVRSRLTEYAGILPDEKHPALAQALSIALGIDAEGC